MNKYEVVYQLKRKGKMKSEENKRKIVRGLIVVFVVVFLLGAIAPLLSTTAESEKVGQVSDRMLTTDVLDKTITLQSDKAKDDVNYSTATWNVDSKIQNKHLLETVICDAVSNTLNMSDNYTSGNHSYGNETRANFTILNLSTNISNSVNSSTSARSPGTVTVYGYVCYYNENWNLRPVKHARVELWDDWDTSARKTTHTNENGYYQFPAIDNWELDLDQYRLDLRVKVFTDNGKVWVNKGFPSYYTFWVESPTRNNIPDGWQEISGAVSDADENKRAPFHIYSMMMWEWKWFKDNTGYERGDVWVYYPSSASNSQYSRGGDYIDIISSHRWETNVIQHEYAHAIMSGVFVLGIADAWPSGADHQMDWEVNRELAFFEGWANFLPCAVQNNGYWRGWNIEYGNSWFVNDGYLVYGQPASPDDRFEDTRTGHEGPDDYAAIEGNPTGIFWDIFDSSTSDDTYYPDNDSYDDDDISLCIDEIWDVIRYYDPDTSYSDYGLTHNHPYDINQFWDGWFARGHGNTHWMKAIYYNHGICKMTENFPTITGLTPTDGYYKDTITLTATGISDADSEDQSYLRVRFEYYYDANSNGLADDGNEWQPIDESTGSSGTRYAYWDTSSLSDDEII